MTQTLAKKMAFDPALNIAELSFTPIGTFVRGRPSLSADRPPLE